MSANDVFPPADPTITNFTVTPRVVAGLESGCLDSDPHDNFTLVCTARKPAVVLPQLEVVWLHNGADREGNVTAMDGGAFKTNMIYVPEANFSDVGSYECVARVVIPASPEVNTSGSSQVIITGEPPSAVLA